MDEYALALFKNNKMLDTIQQTCRMKNLSLIGADIGTESVSGINVCKGIPTGVPRILGESETSDGGSRSKFSDY